jgi:hypothetical protein
VAPRYGALCRTPSRPSLFCPRVGCTVNSCSLGQRRRGLRARLTVAQHGSRGRSRTSPTYFTLSRRRSPRPAHHSIQRCSPQNLHYAKATPTTHPSPTHPSTRPAAPTTSPAIRQHGFGSRLRSGTASSPLSAKVPSSSPTPINMIMAPTKSQTQSTPLGPAPPRPAPLAPAPPRPAQRRQQPPRLRHQLCSLRSAAQYLTPPAHARCP